MNESNMHVVKTLVIRLMNSRVPGQCSNTIPVKLGLSVLTAQQ